MSERLSGQEFADQLPKAAEFDRGRKMANRAAELATAIREQLEAEVSAKNEELEEKGLVGRWVEFETSEEFVPDDSGLVYNFYGPHTAGSRSLQSVSGMFNSLILLDTSGAIVRNMSGLRLKGIEPQRFVVCAAIAESDLATLSYVPLRGIETPLLPRTEFYDDLARAALGEN